MNGLWYFRLLFIIDHQSLLTLATNDRKEFSKSINRKILFLETYFVTFYFKRQVVKKKKKKKNTKLSIWVISEMWSFW